MKTIAVHGLQLQFESDQLTTGKAEKQAIQAIELINALLQREPDRLGAQIIANRDEIDVEEVDEEDEFEGSLPGQGAGVVG
jgi:hypothetical protein